MMQPRLPRDGFAAAASTAPNQNPTIWKSRLPEAGSVVSGNMAVNNKMPISWQPWLPWAGFAAAADRA